MKVHKSVLFHNVLPAAVASVLLSVGSTQAAINLLVDPVYPSAFLTVDPELHNPAARNVAADRVLTQTFQLDAGLTVRGIALSLAVGGDGNNGGLILSFYETDDVHAATWTPGALVKTLTIDITTALPETDARLGLNLGGADVFALAARNTDSQGYGLEVSNVDGSSNLGALRHTHDGSDGYTGGQFYKEGGVPSSGSEPRDFGVGLSDRPLVVPEPTTFAFLGLGGLAALMIRRTKR